MLRTEGGCQFTPRTMRLMFDTMDAYDADFDRLAEIYAEDAQWRNANLNGPHCHNRDDIFAMFRRRMDAGIRVAFDELRSTPTEVVLTARATDFGGVVSVFSFQGRRIMTVKDYPSMEAAQAAIAGPSRAPPERRWRRWLRWRPGCAADRERPLAQH
jgi:limonene-1,2-epoxide hydrolase